MTATRTAGVRTSGYRGRRGGFDRVTEEDLLFSLTPPATEPEERDRPARAAKPKRRARSCQAQAVLTLGGTPTPVLVHVEPPSEWPAPGSDLPLFEMSCALQDDMAERLEQSRQNRRVLEQTFNLADSCQTTDTQPVALVPVLPVEDAVGRPCRGDERTALQTEASIKPLPSPRRRPSIMDLLDRQPTRRHNPFRWRRFFVSAAVSSGLGSAALLTLYWIGG